MKGQVIFADKEEQEKQTQQKRKKDAPEKIKLSRGEYREVIKEAYKEGMQDALDEKQPSPVQQDSDKKNSVLKTLAPEQKSKREREVEAHKTEAKKRVQTRQKLENIVDRHDIELVRAHGVFPFDFFPDSVIIDTTKITLVRKQMFATEAITTIPLKDVADTQVQTALFLASVTIAYMPHATSPGMLRAETETISCLRRSDAIAIKNILKGVLVAIAEEIDLARLTPEEVANVIARFGHSEGVE